MRRSSDYDRTADTLRDDEPEDGLALCWSWYEPRNFGDWVGPYLFEAITGVAPRHCPPSSTHYRSCHFSAGSIMQFVRGAGLATIWGTGIISRTERFKQPKSVLAVRGPETRRRFLELGYDCPEVFGDPAILLPWYFQPAPSPRRRGGTLLPHFVDYKRVASLASADTHVIDVTLPVEDVVGQIAASEFVLSSSLHGLIVAHAYGVPATWIASGCQLMGDDVKFHDYYASLGCAAERHDVPDFSKKAVNRLSVHATCPDQSGLRDALLEACPFRR